MIENKRTYSYFMHDIAMTNTTNPNTWSRRHIQQRVDNSHFVATNISRPESVQILFVGDNEGYSLCE
jgi:hypothetical protein